jgi:DNA-binding transcriptional MerR regulator
MQDKNLLTIRQLSLKLNIPKPTLRYWEKELCGFIVPIRTRGGQRRYTAENISMVEEVKKLRKRGMSLAEIKRRLSNGDNGDNSNSDRIGLLADRVAEVVRAEVNRFFEGEEER